MCLYGLRFPVARQIFVGEGRGQTSRVRNHDPISRGERTREYSYLDANNEGGGGGGVDCTCHTSTYTH